MKFFKTLTAHFLQFLPGSVVSHWESELSSLHLQSWLFSASLAALPAAAVAVANDNLAALW